MPETDYSLTGHAARAAAAPALPYRPADPAEYRPGIGMIGAGGISEWHLRAYRAAGYNVVALCDLIPERAEGRRAEFFPSAQVYTDYRELLARPDIEVVDIATHPAERVEIIRDGLLAGKHVLSQKPFVLDIETGKQLVALAAESGRKLAVNQNGRWAPHFSYVRHAVRAGLIGEVLSVHMGVHWDHTWTIGTKFEEIDDLILYDFAIHWFDMARALIGERPISRVFASRARAHAQKAKPPMLAQALIEFEGGQASLVFDAHIPNGALDAAVVGGTKGMIVSSGPSLSEQRVTLHTAAGSAVPELEGQWFPDGFHGTMGELLCSIEQDREPVNSACENLRSLELCFAAIASAHEGTPKRPGDVTRLPGT